MHDQEDEQRHRSSARPSRRDFVRGGAVAGASLAVGAAVGASPRALGGDAGGLASGTGSARAGTGTGIRPITIAGYDYDRVAGLINGDVPVEGCAVTFEVDSIGAMNTHIFSGAGTRAVSEVGLSPYIHAFANDDFRDYTLLPVFPLRTFRHKSIFIRPDHGIDRPEDLRGKRIATPGYSSTSLTWIRGILEHEYGVRPDEVEWVIAARDSSAAASGGASKQERLLPSGLSISDGTPGKDESDLLVDGEVDALFHAAEPKAFLAGDPDCVRLFADSKATEQAYFRKTGIFPIMHAVAVRRDLADDDPAFLAAVFDAYAQSKQRTYDFLAKSAWYKQSLPWIAEEFRATRALMGDNYWSYGVEPNRAALEALFAYAFEQGLAKRTVTVEEVFHPAALALVEA